MSVGVRYVRKRLHLRHRGRRREAAAHREQPERHRGVLHLQPGYGLTQVLNPDFPSFKTPRAQRDYDGVELRLHEAVRRNWSLNASYLWSRLYSATTRDWRAPTKYDGPHRPEREPLLRRALHELERARRSQPRAAVHGSPPPGQAPGHLRFQVRNHGGPQRHVSKRVPVGALVSWQGYPVFISTRDSLGRTPFQQRYDLYVQHNVRFAGHPHRSTWASTSRTCST